MSPDNLCGSVKYLCLPVCPRMSLCLSRSLWSSQSLFLNLSLLPQLAPVVVSISVCISAGFSLSTRTPYSKPCRRSERSLSSVWPATSPAHLISSAGTTISLSVAELRHCRHTSGHGDETFRMRVWRYQKRARNRRRISVHILLQHQRSIKCPSKRKSAETFVLVSRLPTQSPRRPGMRVLVQ